METNLTDAASISATLELNAFNVSVLPLLPFPSPDQLIILPRSVILNLNSYLHTNLIRIAILDVYPKDSDLRNLAESPPTVAMIVPLNREADWIFSTKEGQVHLLLGATRIARFILIGNDPSGEGCSWRMYTKPENEEELLNQAEYCLDPFLSRFLPKQSIYMGNFDITFLRYVDNLVNAVVLGTFVGPIVGEMLVEDVEIEDGAGREFRRRLRFKRMPNLVQTSIKIIPESTPDSDSLSLRDMKFRPDLSALVDVYLAPMAASLSLISAHLQSCFGSKIRPKVLCLGVGGGSLVGFLVTQFNFDVVALEIDQVVWNTAKKYFGLEQYKKSVRVRIGDGIEFLKKLKSKYDSEANSYKPDDTFEAIMVDLEPRDLSDMRVPPSKFRHQQVISAAKGCLSRTGLLVLNVISLTEMDFEILVLELRAEFVELYKIDAGNGKNVVVIATRSTIDISNGVPTIAFMSKLKSLKPGEFMDKIEKI